MLSKNKGHLSIANLYIGLFCVYNLQGTFYPKGSIIAKIILMIILIISLYYWIYANRHYKLPSFLKILNILILMFTIYGLFFQFFSINVIFKGSIALNAVEYLKNIYKSLLPIYSCFVFLKKGMLDKSSIILWVPIFLCTCAGQFYAFGQHAMMSTEYDVDGITNNTAYDFLSLFPLLYFFKDRKIYQYIMLLVIIVFVIYGMKRGAMLISFFMLFYFLFSGFQYSTNKQKILMLVLCGVVVFVGILAIENLMNNSSYFQYRLSQTMEGSSSERDVYYSHLINHFLTQQNIFEFLFGGGAFYSVVLVGNQAHNDWLELLVSNGIIGTFVYFLYFVSLFVYYSKNKKMGYNQIIVPYIIFILLKSFFSMSYTGHTIYMILALSYAINQISIGKMDSCNE